jgi:toxin ParE1/3/4
VKVRWTRPALGHLDAIGDWIAADNPHAAETMVRRIHGVVLGLREQPEMGRPGRVDGTRELVVAGTSYIVAYRLGPDAVDVLAVFHARRRWPDRF